MTISRAGRRILRSDRLRRALCWLIHGYIHLVYRTNRWQVEGAEGALRLRAEGRGFILAFWHGRLLMIPMAWQRLAPMHMLISAHRDGRIIADAVTYFGVRSIAGSTRRGGSAALRTMVKRLKDGDCVGITPDGPRGPAMTASLGIVNLARLSGAPIVPITYATSRRRVWSSWDRFHLPLPYGRGVYLWGEPIALAADLDEAGLDEARRLLETRMVALTREADRRVGAASPPPQPSPIEGEGAQRKPSPLMPYLYRALTGLLTPLAPALLHWRARRGKEDSARIGERRGIAGRKRPEAPLVWVHAASVGEATAILELIERILRERPGCEFLVTTGTVTSARLLAARLPAGARHQFVPLDLPLYVARFLDHWRPDLALWVESELWPNLVLATRARGIPLILVNARLSARAYTRWRRHPGLITPMLGAYALCLAQSEEQAERFRRLGAGAVASLGDLKAAAPPLPVDPVALRRLSRQVAGRPLWLAASTHDGEEEIAAAVHRAVGSRHERLLTIIAPRHPARGDAIAAMLRGRGLRLARRSRDERIEADTDVYLADTMGELGLFYRLSEIAFIGGSLCARGGHNPFEAARLGCAVMFGPDTGNCAAMAEALLAAGAAETVTRDSLAEAVSALL
ncbi:MAG TPA: glycosyltransferase N-terminal domain-containing protein, partial [Stellaceae bacterium]|nr:glycosyltransferase N-terminal domain-containing protein [Stellaceae bacterium]